ncbi:hypothetical protein [Porphyrobacter sp. AAP82]|uniref:hypothetical protein n=1 Tax=Porphyrobacter sp. AAP82 TaxID=1248917 RepID=UPI0003146B43|nr:hypothetical protein [Porphyrobacter sp. AAP82]
MFTLAAALALAAPEPGTRREDPPVTNLCAMPGEDAASAGATWTIIDAREMDNPSDLADALRLVPAGKRAVVRGGSFKDADMRKVAPLLTGACLAETELEGTNWEGTAIPNLRLVHIDLVGAKAARARWPGLSTHGVNPQGSDFTGADLSGMRFVSARQGADFEGVSFRAANLKDATFACVDVYPSWCINAPGDFSGADLTGTDLSSLGAWEERIAGARIDGTIVAPEALAALVAARIEGPVRLADTFTTVPLEDDLGDDFPPYVPTLVTISADEARTLIAATRSLAEAEDRPSFDCAKAAAPIEKTLCGEYESALRSLDRALAETWAAARAAGKGDLAAQRRWLASRNKCGDDRICLADLYQARIAVLRGALSPGLTLKPGEEVTYYYDSLPLPDAMRTGELYERILPVLMSASEEQITLTGNPDGSVAAEGSAIGSNAHLCDLTVEKARFDPATGWWSARDPETGKTVPLFRIEGRRIIPRYSGNMGDTPDEAKNFISCGARAYFVDATDLTPR